MLHDNSLTGRIPSSLSLPAAVTITLANNKLEGPVPWEGLLTSSSTQTIALNNNKLHGSAPQQLPPTLRHFVIHDNAFEGTAPSFAQTPRLKTLSMHRNRLVGSLRLTTLEEWNATCRDISPTEWDQDFSACSQMVDCDSCKRDPSCDSQMNVPPYNCTEVYISCNAPFL